MIVVYITDARKQYPPTVLTSIGMPTGGVNEYRYRLQWIHPDLHDRWRADELVGEQVLLCFLEGNTGDLSNARATLLRRGQVVWTRIKNGDGIASVRLLGFAPINNLFDLTYLSDSKNILTTGPPRGYFVLQAQIEIGDPRNDEYDAWLSVAKSLAAMATFRNATFAFLEGFFPQTPDSRPMPLRDGRVRLDPEQSYDVRLHSYAPTEESRTHTYGVEIDDRVMRVTVSSPLHFQQRYWTFRLIGNTGITVRGASTNFTLKPTPGVLGTELVQIITVRATVLGRFRRLLLPSLAAATAATAGVLGDVAPIWLKAVMVATGSIGIAITTRRS